MVLAELNRRPGEWCIKCATPTETVPHRDLDGITGWHREPCSSALERFRKTGKGTGSKSGEPLCLASLQAAADRKVGAEKTAA